MKADTKCYVLQSYLTHTGETKQNFFPVYLNTLDTFVLTLSETNNEGES